MNSCGEVSLDSLRLPNLRKFSPCYSAISRRSILCKVGIPGFSNFFSSNTSQEGRHYKLNFSLFSQINSFVNCVL